MAVLSFRCNLCIAPHAATRLHGVIQKTDMDGICHGLHRYEREHKLSICKFKLVYATPYGLVEMYIPFGGMC